MAEPFEFLSATLVGPPSRRSRSGGRGKRLGDIYVEGLDAVVLAAAAEGKDVRRKLQARIRKLVRPAVVDARNRFQALPGTGPRVAKSVRLQFKGEAAVLSFGGLPFAFGREFGAKREWTRRHIAKIGSGGKAVVVARKMGYGSNEKIFGKGWTGNRFDIGTAGTRLTIQQPAGRAFYPAVAEHVQRIDEGLQALVAEELRKISGGQ